jgi:DNA end-binding protein Ku
MAARAIWKGHLRLSLVTIPIRVYPATNPAATISFNQLHRVCQTRIQYKKWCPHCEREVARDEIVKGYEFERGQYVPVEEEEIDKVRPESTRVVALSQFTDADAIDPVFIDTPYYLGPDGKVAAESFAVMREALKGKAGIGTLAMHGRDRLVAIEPRGRGLIMFTLRHEREIRDIEAIDELKDAPEKVKAEELALARKVIGGFEDRVDFSKYPDTYEEALREMVDAKIKGREIISTEEPVERPKVVNLMDALRKSLDEASRAKKRPAKAPAAPKRRGTKAARPSRRRASA